MFAMPSSSRVTSLWCILLAAVTIALMLAPLSSAALLPTAPPLAVSALKARGKNDSRQQRPILRKVKGAASSVLHIARKPFRDLSFWARTSHIYTSYKLKQLRSGRLARGLSRVLPNRRNKAKAGLEAPFAPDFNSTHEINSRRMIDLCLSMRGFYLKTGQFLGTRHDFMPLTYIKKLSQLHDNVPPLTGSEVRGIMERDLGGPVESFFSSIDLDKPLGAASIAQVHKGVWRATGQNVAVKVQYPNAERLMKGDLANLRRLAEFLQKTELKFDLLSAIKELQKQIKNEFDFIGEANNMDSIRAGLSSRVPAVTLPQSILATKNLLVMTFVEGSNLSKLKEFNTNNMPAFVKRQYGKRLLDVLAAAWGCMIFELRAFNADPHPGNICIGSSGKIGLLDWGQVKRVSDPLALKFGTLVLAMSENKENAIVDALFDLGVCVSNPSDRKTVSAIAVTMLDTKRVPGYVIDPFDPRNSLKTNSVTKMPSELYFVVRTVQLLRGIAHAFDLDYSLADKWAPYARKEVLKVKTAAAARTSPP